VPFLTREPISPAELLAAVRRDGDGGLALFIGVVRDRHEGRTVLFLEYEAYEPMAEKELARISEDLAVRHPEARILLRHRIGRLGIGEVAVVVAAAAPHREEAFAACRDGIETVKSRAPVWKKEWGPDGSFWVEGCAVAPAPKVVENKTT
jgi:molybdopterin synthase catalytic subunit